MLCAAGCVGRISQRFALSCHVMYPHAPNEKGADHYQAKAHPNCPTCQSSYAAHRCEFCRVSQGASLTPQVCRRVWNRRTRGSLHEMARHQCRHHNWTLVMRVMPFRSQCCCSPPCSCLGRGVSRIPGVLGWCRFGQHHTALLH
jgi:hypothetical protein